MEIKHPWLLFFGIALGPFMVGIDMLAIGVAVEPMTRALMISIATLQWFITAFAIGNSSFQASSGKFADLFGLKRILLYGLIGFILSSLFISLTSSPFLIIVFRLIQGACGGTLPTLGIAIFMSLYPPSERGKWISGLVGFGGLGWVLGPAVGGYLIHVLSWRAIFWINVPIGIVAVLLNWIFIPKIPLKASPGEKIDWKGVIFFTTTLILFTIGISQGHYWGWGNYKTLLVFACTLLILAIYLYFERRTKQPLIEFALFKVRNFLVANIAGFFAYFMLTAWILIFGIYMQKVAGMSALQAGINFFPFGLMTAIGATQMGKFQKRFGPKRLIVAGYFATLIAFIGMATLPTLPSHLHLWIFFGIYGLGFVLINSSSVPAGLEFIPVEKAGISSAKSMMMRWLGGAMGSAIMATLFITHSWIYLQKHTSSISTLATDTAQSTLHDIITADKPSTDLASLFPSENALQMQNLISHSFHHGLVMTMGICAIISLLVLITCQIFLKEKEA